MLIRAGLCIPNRRNRFNCTWNATRGADREISRGPSADQVRVSVVPLGTVGPAIVNPVTPRYGHEFRYGPHGRPTFLRPMLLRVEPIASELAA